MHRLSPGRTVALAALAVMALSVSPASQVRRSGRFEVENVNGAGAVAREALVKFRDPVSPARARALTVSIDPDTAEPLGRTGLARVRSRSLSVAQIIATLSGRPDIEYVEPNYLVRTFAEPNDPLFPMLWGLRNVGQAVNGGSPGVPGADIRATAAWDVAVGTAAHVVAIVDTGIDYTHVDLAPNVWSAPTDFTVTIGGVAITCRAGTHGFNAINRTCDPMDDHNHGTHVAGTIGAAPNNGVGVSGVSWVASLMGLKFLDANGSGSIGDAIAAVDFALQTKSIFAGSGGADIRVLSNSWGSGNFSQAFLDSVNAANSNDMLFVAAAGNSGLPNDWFPTYPASYIAPNVISVAATTSTDSRAFFSNYGKNSVHLGAPGLDILSTIRGDEYAFLSGTSMATPHVSGAAAAVLSHCALDTSQLKAVLVDSVDAIPSLASLTISGGRLNLLRALEGCSAPPATPGNLKAAGADAQVKLTWAAAANATHYTVKRAAASGGPYAVVNATVRALEYTDTGLLNATPYYYVVSAANVLGESGDSSEATATPQPPSDLTITSFTAPSAGAAGSSLGVSVTTKNRGVGPAFPSTTALYVSTGAPGGTGDVRLNGSANVPALAPGTSSSSAVTINLPPELAAGMYYLIARADADNVLLESSKANNASSRSFAVGPDLVVSSLSLPQTGVPGAPVVASYTVKNTGADSAAASTVQFYWSANSVFDASDALLGTAGVGVLAPLALQQGQMTLMTPAGVAWGTYYVLAVADALMVVPESRDTNNTTSAVVRIGGDLVVSSLSAPSALGEARSFTATDTTKNSGGSDVTPSTTHFYLSSDAALSAADALLGSRAVDALAPGGVSVGSVTLTVPAGTPLGRYYLLAKADGPNALTETQENNNVTSRSVTVGPDLTTAISSASSPARAGLATNVNESVTNKGGNDAGETAVRFYLSRDWKLDASDVPLTQTRAVPPLPAGASSAGSTGVTIPAGTTAGSYYLLAQADGWGAVGESSESNNVAYKAITVE